MQNEIILFENQNIKLEVNMKDETVWLSQKQILKKIQYFLKKERKHLLKLF